MNVKAAQLLAELEKVRAANADHQLVPDEAIEYARRHPSSALHARLTWDDADAGVLYRRSQMQQLIRAVYVINDPSPQPVHAYWSPPSHRRGHEGYVYVDTVRTNPEVAIEIAQDILKRIRSGHDDLSVAVDALPVLQRPAISLGKAVQDLEDIIVRAEPRQKPKPKRLASPKRKGKRARQMA